MKSQINTIEEAIEDIKQGKIIIVIDDEDRENEGDFIMAAEHVTPEAINFMATHGRGLICCPLLESRCNELGLELMVQDNTALHATPFTVSVDLIGHGCTTGISASDRAKTVQALVDPDTNPRDLGKPGHIFPLRAKEGGVLRRTGHTEASIDLARLAGLKPAGVLIEIMNEDGTMARLPQLLEIAKKFEMKIVSIEDLVAYRMQQERLISREVELEVNSEYGKVKLIAYKQLTTGDEHLAVTIGKWEENDPVLVRMHSSSSNLGDIFSAFKHDRPSLLSRAFEYIHQEGTGVVVYMQQGVRGDGLIENLKLYKQSHENDNGDMQSLDYNIKMDEKDYGVGAQILRDLGIRKMRLMSNKAQHRTGIVGYGLEIVETIPAD
ncbi:MAG: 3,4-dihydroxy-2-butanone-4-phosphate synthase [Crocinitomicaceae bacterium]|nr:3,4-dihydroxy-2-butanone-4-phosphate synthase [Crocinitomicaceae bacterium]|tara:strand:- start:9141 stop:10280 length:1140 start_codon:yes stop_codon:yes gene_type:complete